MPIVGLLVLFLLSALASLDAVTTWDEPVYVMSGASYARWFGTLSRDSLTRASIDRSWGPNHEHPPAAKLAYGVAITLGKSLGFSALLGVRLVATLLFVTLVGLAGWFVSAHYGRVAGILTGSALALMPRVFGDGHLAALDVPVALAMFAATMVFVRAGTNGRRAAWAGLLWGVALLTKLNAVFLPVILVPWALWRFRRRALLPCLVLLLVGGTTFFAGWPWLWHDTARRAREYVVNKSERIEPGERPTGTTTIPVYYFGQTYRECPAPWHYPFVLTLATVPVGLLLLSGIGVPAALRTCRRKCVASCVTSPDRKTERGQVAPSLAQATTFSFRLGRARQKRRDDRAGANPVGLLILGSALLPMLILAWPSVPKYDGVRLLMPAFPFIACLAGIGGAHLWTRGRTGKRAVLAIAAVGALELAFTHPYELSYYNEAVGGAWGADKLGLETTYWGDTVTFAVIDYMNEHCPDGSTVILRPPYLGSLPGLKDSLRVADPGDPAAADFLLLFPRQGYLGAWEKQAVRERKPMRQWTYLAVPQCMLFDLRVQATPGSGS